MTPENLPDESIDKDHCAAGHMKAIVSDYGLPESYQRLVNGPWRLVAQAVIDQYGDESDAWGRMTWFTRILCTAIETSLERNNPEPVKDALNGFSIWLNSLRDDGDAHSMCVSAANYAQRRISTQITEDTCEAEHPIATVDEAMEKEQKEASTTSLEQDDREDDNLSDKQEGGAENEPGAVEHARAEEQACEEEQASENPSSAVADEEQLAVTTLPIADEPSVTSPEQDGALETLSLSLAYSAGKPVNESSTPEEQDALPEQTERGTDMDIPSQVAVSEKPVNPAESGASPAAESLALDSRLTEPSSVAPVPMGTWLAFHDQDIPTLASLSMYDPQAEEFVLGNQNGIVVRKIQKAELMRLISAGVVQKVAMTAIAQ